jgi:sugar lactone lactonase YvrE
MSENTWQSSAVFEARARLGEGPVWDARARRLYWVDIYNHRIHRFDPTARQDEIFRLPEIVTCVVPTRAGLLLLALRHDLALLDPSTEELTRILTLEADRPDQRFNDGKVDSRGRFWIGTMSVEGLAHGALYRYNAGGSVRTMQSGLSISNGMGWSPDGGTFYHTDSPLRRIYAYDYDEESGEITGRRVFADLTGSPAFPDGLAVDAEGCVWSAQWDGWCVIRFAPDGREIRRLELPVQRPTSCCFGGPELRTLYITSASVGLSEREIQLCPLSGDLFWVETETQGLPGQPFDDTPQTDDRPA